MSRNTFVKWMLGLTLAVAGCGESADSLEAEVLPYASEVVRFTPGEGAGFGQSKMPEVVLGPPQGKGVTAGSLDVLSLGKGGEIVLGFGERVIVDGPGADFVVFENVFWPAGNEDEVYAEPGEVAVSMDGENWTVFPCNVTSYDPNVQRDLELLKGCAGTTPAHAYDAEALVPLDPALSGGDAFDLAEIGVSEVRYVRIRDVSHHGETPSAGFDLDAVGVVHFR